MMKRYIFIFLVFAAQQSLAQKGVSVVYEYQYRESSLDKLLILLAVNDTVSFQTTIASRNKNTRYKKPLGSGFQSHDMYLHSVRNLALSQSHFEGRKKYLVVDTIIKYNWVEAEGEQEILGYACKKAVAKNGDDVFIAWYAPSLPYSFGPDDKTGLPGLILELTNNRFHRTYKAVKISLEPMPVVEPTEGSRITRQEYAKVLQRLK
jgi:GLPGLI family protein